MDGAATPVNWGHHLAPTGTAGIINQPSNEVGVEVERSGPGQGHSAGVLSSVPSRVGTPSRPFPPPPPSLLCRILRVVGARVSYRLLPGGCSCSPRSMDRRTQEWTHGRGRPGGSTALLPAGSGAGLQAGQLCCIIPCFSVSIETASPTPRAVSAEE